MAGIKTTVAFELQEDVVRMLDNIAQRYGFGDKSKALRVLLDYTASHPHKWDEIFEQIHCVRCGGRPGWES